MKKLLLLLAIPGLLIALLAISASAPQPLMAQSPVGNTCTDLTPPIMIKYSNTFSICKSGVWTQFWPLQATDMPTSAVFGGHVTVEGVLATGATGTGQFVFDTSPTLVTPVLGTATGTGLTLSSFGKVTPVAVGSLPTCDSGAKGKFASVNDATTPVLGSSVANGGAAFAAVVCNGSAWTVTGK